MNGLASKLFPFCAASYAGHCAPLLHSHASDEKAISQLFQGHLCSLRLCGTDGTRPLALLGLCFQSTCHTTRGSQRTLEHLN